VPFSLVTFSWAGKRKSPAAGLPPAKLKRQRTKVLRWAAIVLSAVAPGNVPVAGSACDGRRREKQKYQ